MPTLEAMRSSFRRRAAGLADALTGGDSDVDTYLNHAYQFKVPDRVPGQLTEGTWVQQTTQGKASYAFPNWVHSVKRHARIGNVDLNLYGHEVEFWANRNPEDITEQKPTSVLVKGGEVRFHKIPDLAYDVTFNTRNYPNDGMSLSSIPIAGIDHFIHADAAVWGGVQEFAEDYDLDKLLAKSDAKFEKAVMVLRSRSLTRPMDRRRRSTY